MQDQANVSSPQQQAPQHRSGPRVRSALSSSCNTSFCELENFCLFQLATSLLLSFLYNAVGTISEFAKSHDLKSRPHPCNPCNPNRLGISANLLTLDSMRHFSAKTGVKIGPPPQTPGPYVPNIIANRGAMYEHLRVVPPGKRLRVPSCTRPEILGSG